jgi:hypothetical protein
MESSNAIMIRDNIQQRDRLKKLNDYALVQIESLQKSVSIQKLKNIEPKDLVN